MKRKKVNMRSDYIHSWRWRLSKTNHIRWHWCAIDSFNVNGLKCTRFEQCHDPVVMQQYLGRPKQDLSWPSRGFQPRTLRGLVFAVSLKFLVSIDYISNASFYTDWYKAWKPIDHILLRQVATASLEPGKSTGAPWKSTAHQKRALFRKVCEYRFNIARTLTERMSILYAECVGRKMINNRLAARGYHARKFLRKPMLTANHRRLCLDWAWSWQNLTAADWSHVIWGYESRFQLYPVDGHIRVRRLPRECFQEDCQASGHLAGHLITIC